MNFILLTDYYHPIIKSGSIVIGDLATELLRQGHTVTIMTFVSDQKNQCDDFKDDRLRILRIKISGRKYGMVGRLYAENCYSSKVIKILKKVEDISCDAVICLSPSIFYGKAIGWLKEKYKVKAYLICRDIFPKWAVDAGIIKKGLLYRYFKYIERNLYNSVDFIGIESKSDIDYFIQYVESEKVEVLDNWGSPLNIVKTKASPSSLNSEKINILYGGNMAEAQDLLSLVQLLDDSILEEKAILTLIGSGHQLEAIKKTINANKIKNVVILPQVDRETYISILSEADVGLVSLNKKLESNNFPLKMMGYMQFSKPILASVNKNNEIIEMIKKHNVGLVSIAGEAESLNKNFSTIINNTKLRETQGKNALELFNKRFTVKAAVSKIIGRF